jgi:hypothetical protein
MNWNRSLLVAVVLLAMPDPGMGASFPPTEKLSSEYQSLIEKSIQICRSKSCRCTSRSEAIRRDAAIACMKAAYLRTFQSDLIRRMIEEEIQPNPFHVRLYVNHSFHDTIKSRKRTGILPAYSPKTEQETLRVGSSPTASP